MTRLLISVFKQSFRTAPELVHVLVGLLGLALVFSGGEYHHLGVPTQIFILIIYLTFLVGIAPIPMPTFSTNFRQVVYVGLISSVLDSFVLLAQLKKMRATKNDETRIKLLALFTISALIGGLCIWFGEVYAAGLFTNDGRTGIASALFIVPPVLVFLSVLGWHANKLGVTLERGRHRPSKVNLYEFVGGVALLLYTHDPIVCTGVLLIYATITGQQGHLFDQVLKNQIEWPIIVVIILAMAKGDWLVQQVFLPLGIATGDWAIIPSAVQAVLWGPLYKDPGVHFWVRLANLSTGAMILPISSLVGVMLFKTPREWVLYLRYSIPYAVLWFGLMRGWIYIALESPVGELLERFTH